MSHTSTSSLQLIPWMDVHSEKALCFIEVWPFLLQLIEDLHPGTKSRVQVGGQLSQSFATKLGILQGWIPAPSLFCTASDRIMSQCENTMRITTDISWLTDQDNDDNTVLFTKCSAQWHKILTGFNFNDAAETISLCTSWIKTKLQNVGCGFAPPPMHIQEQAVEVTEHFTYFGSDLLSLSIKLVNMTWVALSCSHCDVAKQTLQIRRISECSCPFISDVTNYLD